MVDKLCALWSARDAAQGFGAACLHPVGMRSAPRPCTHPSPRRTQLSTNFNSLTALMCGGTASWRSCLCGLVVVLVVAVWGAAGAGYEEVDGLALCEVLA